MKTSSLQVFALIGGVVFILLSAYIMFGTPTKKEGFAASPLPKPPPPKPAAKPVPTGVVPPAIAAAAAANVAAVAAARLPPPPPPLSKADFEAQNTRIANLTSALEIKENALKKVTQEREEGRQLIEEKLGTIKNLNERLDISEEIKNLTLKEVNDTQKLLEIALAERETSEVNLRLTKLNLDEQVRKNLKLNQSVASSKKETAQQDDHCIRTDKELLQLKQNLQRYNVEKQVSDDLVKQLKIQVDSSRKNEPAAQKLSAELERAASQNKQISTQLEQTKTKLAAIEKESATQKAQLIELKTTTKRLEADKDIIQREMLVSQGRYDTERVAKITADAQISMLEAKMASREKISAAIEAQYKLLKGQCAALEKKYAVGKEQKSALQAGVDKQSAELATLKAQPPPAKALVKAPVKR